MAAARVVSLMWSQHRFVSQFAVNQIFEFRGFLWDGGGRCINTDLGVVPDVIKFLGTEDDLGANQGVVGVTVSTVKCTDGCVLLLSEAAVVC